MHVVCRAAKTISLKLEACEKLRSVRRHPDESFSQVILRAVWPEETLTAGDLLERTRSRPPFLSAEALDRIEKASQSDLPPPDKWDSR